MHPLSSDIAKMSAKVFGSQWAPSRVESDYGAGLDRMFDSAEFDFMLRGYNVRIELKAARSSSRDIFTFQYIRPDSFDVCVCLAWHNDVYQYLIFTSPEIRPHLTRQHRDSHAFQLRLSQNQLTRHSARLAAPDALQDKLNAAAERAYTRRILVRLDPTLAGIEGWHNVARSMSKRLKREGFDQWRIFLRHLEA